MAATVLFSLGWRHHTNTNPMPHQLVALDSAVFLFVVPTLLWLLSLRLRDASIVDIFWGMGFVGIAWIAMRLGDGAPLRKLWMVSLTTLWGVRLSGYLAWRNLGKGEDPRYQAMRKRHGEKWPLRSLLIVFWLQAALIFVISLPLQVAMSVPTPVELGVFDVLGMVLVLCGTACETIADVQLAAWKRHPEHRGKVMQVGLWRYTRHPNYFGDFLVWWGLFFGALATGSGLWTVLSPLLMSFLLLRVSGVPLLEKSMNSRPGYAEYVRRTSSFFPRPPRK